jgi:DNA-binding Lrp family transcriptional regulator
MLHRIDDKDWKIIEILKEHGEYTTRQIAKKTLLPSTTIHNRIRSLKNNNIIKKFTITLDNSLIGRGFLAYVLISVDLHTLKSRHKTQIDIIKELKRFYFVERADIVSGGTDMIALVRVKDVKEFDKVLLEKIQMIEGIEKTQSMIVIHEE